MFRLLTQLCLLLCLSVSLSRPLFPQGASGSLTGTVTDPNGAAVPDAKVTVKQDETGQETSTVTTGTGAYLFPALAVGPYTVSVEKTGFRRLSNTGLVIAIANRSVLDLSLTLGEVSQSVEVRDQPPLLAAATSEVGTNFQPKFMVDGPLFVGGNVRNPMNFVSFMPGVNGGFQEGSIVGSSRRSQEILIDGASNVNTESGGVSFQFGSPEQFGEFKLLTNTFSAEFGRTGSGIQIYTTRSGTNELHGNVFNFLRNDALDAAGWGVNSRRVFPENDTRNPRKPKVRQNEFGYAVGGPVYLPKIYDGRNRTFFYTTFNGFEQAAGTATTSQTLATARMRNGDFSELPFQIYDPATTQADGTRSPFPGNIIPTNRFSSVSRAILPLIPQPTSPGLSGNYVGFSFSDITRRFFSFKGDHAFSDRNRLNGFASFQRNKVFSDGPLPGALTNGNQTRDDPETYRLNHDFTFTPTLLNHFTFGFTRFQNLTLQAPANLETNWPEALGLRGVETGTSAAFPLVGFTSNSLSGFGRLQTRASQYNWTTHFSDALTWIRGQHSFKFGFDWREQRTFQDPPDDAGVQGEFRFSNFQTAGNNTTLRSNTGYAFASFLLGEVDYGRRFINAPNGGVNAYYGYRAAYVQDDWKINSRLTLNLGLRWDLGLAREDRNGTQATFNPDIPNAAAGGRLGALSFIGFGEGRLNQKRFGDIYWRDFGPRVGFAFQLDPKTVLRGGYGLFYSPSNGLIGGACFPCGFGQSSVPERVSDSFRAAFNWDGGFQLPAGFVPPPTIRPDAFNGQSVSLLTAEDGRHARINNWSFNIQRELPWKFLVDVAYIGSYTDRLNARVPVNQVRPEFLRLGTLLGMNIDSAAVQAAGFSRPYPSFTGTLAQALRPYPQFLDISANYTAQGSSRYNGMILKVERRYSDFNLLMGYTYSRALMYRGADSSNCGCIQPQDAYNTDVERSIHTNDIPHTLNILSTWDLPFGRGKRFLASSSRAIRTVVSGWTVSTAQQYRSGTLLRVNLPNSLGPGVLFTRDIRPNVTGQTFGTGAERTDLDPNNPNVRWLNAGAFSLPAPFSFGNASIFYNEFRNPPFFLENLGLVKRTPITESVNVELRADMQNVLNRTLFGNINTTLNGPDFGRPTGVMVGPRIIQMALRVNF